MKSLSLSAEEREILSHLSLEQLQFFSEIANHKSFKTFVDLVNLIIDQEKNIFFKQSEFDQNKLVALHSFARGGVAKLANLIHIIAASTNELQRRGKDESISRNI